MPFTPLSPLPIGKYWPAPLSPLAPHGHLRPVFLAPPSLFPYAMSVMSVVWRNALGLPVLSRALCPVVLDSKAYLGILTFIPWDSTWGRGKVPYPYNLLILPEPLEPTGERGNGVRYLVLTIPGINNLKPLFLASRMGKVFSINRDTRETKHKCSLRPATCLNMNF